MRLLAIETAGRTGSIALSQDNMILREAAFAHGLAQAAGLVKLVADACESVGWQAAAIEVIAVDVGPGSFTGLRIGVTLAKTLAMVTGAKIVAVSGSAVLAANVTDPAIQHVRTWLDAKRGQGFTAMFALGKDGWREVEPANVATPTAALARSPRDVLIQGDGIVQHPVAFDGYSLADESLWQPRAEVVLRLGRMLALEQTFADPLTLEPAYIRLPEPEEKRLAAMSAGSLP